MLHRDIPTLLVSGVSLHRSDDERESELTQRLMDGLLSVARGKWDVVISWGETDGPKVAKNKLDRVDALVVMGGPDITPQFYGGPAEYQNATTHFPKSDDTQLELIIHAIDRGLPMLGICRGMQLLNVATGGTLVQDIAETPGHSTPDLLSDFEFARHTVNIGSGTLLAEILGSARTSNAAQSMGERTITDSSGLSGLRTLIHSAHHQAADRIGLGLALAATADDGIVEAVEHQFAPAVGLQWHPEDPAADPSDLHALLGHMQELAQKTRVAV